MTATLPEPILDPGVEFTLPPFPDPPPGFGPIEVCVVPARRVMPTKNVKTHEAAVGVVEAVLLDSLVVEAYCGNDDGDVYLECKWQVGCAGWTAWKAQRGSAGWKAGAK